MVSRFKQFTFHDMHFGLTLEKIMWVFHILWQYPPESVARLFYYRVSTLGFVWSQNILGTLNARAKAIVSSHGLGR